MKNLILVILFVVLCGCTSDGNNPYSPTQEQTLVSIAYLNSLYDGSVTRITDNIYIEGYLISSDSEGNNYHSLCFEDGTAGVELRVDLDNSFLYFTTFSLYRLFVEGLYISSSGGHICLGASSGDYYVEDLSQVQISGIISHQPDYKVGGGWV